MPDGPALGQTLADEVALAHHLDPAGDDDPDPLPAGLSVDSGDLELALRYVPDYRVVVLAADLDAPSLAAVVTAAAWSGARLVALVPAGSAVDAIPSDATVLERPTTDDGAFAATVAAYAVALDQGIEPAEAFKEAQRVGGWAAVAD
ncbi:MAG: hypothetical protein H0V73_01500 [Chloroflexi bacterium]|nr:hypothetical protein [Chloroflexota bacterium]